MNPHTNEILNFYDRFRFLLNPIDGSLLNWTRKKPSKSVRCALHFVRKRALFRFYWMCLLVPLSHQQKPIFIHFNSFHKWMDVNTIFRLFWCGRVFREIFGFWCDVSSAIWNVLSVRQGFFGRRSCEIKQIYRILQLNRSSGDANSTMQCQKYFCIFPFRWMSDFSCMSNALLLFCSEQNSFRCVKFSWINF